MYIYLSNARGLGWSVATCSFGGLQRSSGLDVHVVFVIIIRRFAVVWYACDSSARVVPCHGSNRETTCSMSYEGRYCKNQITCRTLFAATLLPLTRSDLSNPGWSDESIPSVQCGYMQTRIISMSTRPPLVFLANMHLEVGDKLVPFSFSKMYDH